MLIGYMRPFQDDLHCDHQMEMLTNMNCETMVKEEHSSAKKRVRLKEMLSSLHPGDKVVVTKLYVLADSSRHFVELLALLASMGAYFQSLKEEIDTEKKEAYRLEEIMRYLVDFQSDVTKETTKLGLHKAKQKGLAAGRPRKPDENVQRAIAMYESKKYSLAEIKQETGISKSTLYRYLEQ